MEMLIWMGPPVDNAVIVDVEEEDQLVHGDVDPIETFLKSSA